MKSLTLLLSASLVSAQSAAYGQYSGQGWSGATTCVSRYSCSVVNNWYSQCVPGTTTVATSTAMPLTTPDISIWAMATAASDLKWLGVNEAGAEFGSGEYPGIWGKHFTFPSTNAIAGLVSEGYNIFRVPFSMERLAPTLTSPLSPAYLANLTATINFITSHGAHAIIDPHNFGRFSGSIITNVNDFSTFWGNVAISFAANPNVIFDTNNEYHDMDQQLVLDLNQAAINAIRTAGAKTQYIFIEGNSWSSAWTWNKTNTNLVALTDSEDKLIYEMHQYLDSDGSGTSTACVSGTIGAERVVGATEWLRANGKVGILGEFAGGANEQCKEAVEGLLGHLKENSDVWKGALWWSAGPWWGDYIYSFEAPGGVGYQYYNELLKSYLP